MRIFVLGNIDISGIAVLIEGLESAAFLSVIVRILSFLYKKSFTVVFI